MILILRIIPYAHGKEISEMYMSGLVNIESHSLFHREIFRSSQILDFITPDKMFLPYNFCGSAYLSYTNIGKALISG